MPRTIFYFTKYSILVPELRKHVLTYTNSKIRKQYAQCSRYCDTEIKKFNAKPPRILILTENDEGILVKYSYDLNASSEFERYVPNSVERLFQFSENTMEQVKQYLMRFYRNGREGKTLDLTIDMKKWPAEIMEIEGLSELRFLAVYMHNSMLDGFIQFCQSSATRVEKLYLSDCEGKNQIEIDAEKAKRIFDTSFFQQLPKVEIALDCEVNDEIFLNFKNPFIFLILKKRLISDEAIRRKAAQLTDSAKMNIKINIPADSDPTFDLTTIFSENRLIRYLRHQECRIGNNVFVSLGNRGTNLSIFNKVSS